MPWVVPAHAPPHRSEANPWLWTVTRYDDVAAVLHHPDIGVQEPWTGITRIGERAGRFYGSLVNLTRGVMFDPNDPVHAPMRRRMRQWLGDLGPAFAEPAVAAVVGTHLDQARAGGRCDAMELCRAIPTRVVALALGLSTACLAAIRQASQSLFAVYHGVLPLSLLATLEADAAAAEAVILEECDRARQEPGMGLSRLVLALDGEVSRRSLAGYVFFLVLAAVETLTSLLGNAMLLLLTHPAQACKLAADPALAGRCVEEVLRFAGALHCAAPRVARRPVMIAGVILPAGAVIMPELEQAHHDPAAFEEPGIFDIARQGRPTMAFGAGAHACLGAALGRLQMRIFLQALMRSGPVRLLETEVTWTSHVSFRRLAHLDVAFGRKG